MKIFLFGSLIICVFLLQLILGGYNSQPPVKKDCCTMMQQRIDQLQDKVNLYLDRFNALHSLTSRFGRGILEKDFPDCQFQQLIDEPLKFRVIRCPELLAKFQPAYPNEVITDIFIEVYQKQDFIYDADAWGWQVRSIDLVSK